MTYVQVNVCRRFCWHATMHAMPCVCRGGYSRSILSSLIMLLITTHVKRLVQAVLSDCNIAPLTVSTKTTSKKTSDSDFGQKSNTIINLRQCQNKTPSSSMLQQILCATPNNRTHTDTELVIHDSVLCRQI